MKKWPHWQIAFGAALIALSALFYFLHFTVFHDAHHIFIYLVGDIAFVPIEVLLVTLILHQLLSRREKKVMLHKLNMVIGVFFSETGNALLKQLSGFCTNLGPLQDALKPDAQWTDRNFRDAALRVQATDIEIDCRGRDLAGLQAFLLSRRDSLMRLLENPNLLEHEAFTDVLWAVVHLAEELAARDFSEPRPDSDALHLAGDIKRAYTRMLRAWIDYMAHLKTAYPYLFSLAVRRNPFDPRASVTVQ
ncbi:MAG: hypothetical protein JW951_09060 [Lentisphaerae bacterium]|nr:hypothetical protein [Lentisphaerota bacterium]